MSILFDRKGNDIAIKGANESKDLEFVTNQISENMVINFSIPAHFDDYGYITKIYYSFIGEDGYATPVEVVTNVDSNTIELKNVSIPSSNFIFRPFRIEFSGVSVLDNKYLFIPEGISKKNAVDGGSYSCTSSEMEKLFTYINFFFEGNAVLRADGLYDPEISSERQSFRYYFSLYGNLSAGKKVSECLGFGDKLIYISFERKYNITASLDKTFPYYIKLDNPEQVIISGSNTILFSVYHTESDFLVCKGKSDFIAEEDVVVDIELVTAPTKRNYNYQETIDLTGGVLKVIYKDGKAENKNLPLSSLVSATSQYSYIYGSKIDKIVDITDTTQWICIFYKGCDKFVKYSVTVAKFNPSSMEDVSWETIRLLSQKGKLQDYFSVGDTKSLILDGGDRLFGFSSYPSKAMLVDIDTENKNSVFMLEDRFAFTEYDVSSVTEDPVYNESSLYSFFVNTTAVNGGGWKSCFLKSILEVFVGVLPIELAQILVTNPAQIYSDNVGNGSTSADAITISEDFLFLPSEYEVFGTNTYGNPHESEKLHQWGIYVGSEASDKVKIQKSPKLTLSETPANYWLRTANSRNTNSWLCVNEFGLVEPKESNKVLALNPCWRL